MTNDDWPDTVDERVPALPAQVVELPAQYVARAALCEQAWGRLSVKQKTFLSAWRDCRYNVRAACKQLGLSENYKPNTLWMHEPDYAMVVRIWRANAAADAIDRDRLLARQEDIVETLLTPKPIFHQGIAMLDEHGKPYHEVEAGAAGKANEVLMKVAGMLKDKEIEVNVGVQIGPPTLNIQVMPMPPSKNVRAEHVAIDAKFTEAPSDNGEWLEQ